MSARNLSEIQQILRHDCCREDVGGCRNRVRLIDDFSNRRSAIGRLRDSPSRLDAFPDLRPCEEKLR